MTDKAVSITAGEFAALMSQLGPFEDNPQIAVACSGGSDSMALALLMRDWVSEQRGSLSVLTVDHRLRPESMSEAQNVSDKLQALGFACTVLTRRGPKPKGDIQAEARHARYSLMSRWCAENGYLHLAVAHHLDDQAETFLLRLARGSGVDGLSAMAPAYELKDMRLIRPLLPISADRLRQTIFDRGLSPIVEDPSNANTRFARVRMRNLSPELAAEGMTPERLSTTASRMARARDALDDATAQLLAQTVTLHAEGYCLVKTDSLRRAPPEIALRALARVLCCIGGADYPPRHERLERLYAWIRGEPKGRGRTLLGCKIIRRKSELLICREPAGAARCVLPVEPIVFWDNRFRIRFAETLPAEVRALGSHGWQQVRDEIPASRGSAIPTPVRAGLPAIWSGNSVLAVPHLQFDRLKNAGATKEIAFTPKRPLISARFTLH